MNQEKVEKIYNGRFFKINKALQIGTGLWPYRSRGEKLFFRVIAITTFILCEIPHVYGIITKCGIDLCLCGENIAGGIYVAIVALKYCVNLIYESKIIKLHEQVAENWIILTDPDERGILTQYSERGRFSTISYMVYMIVAGISFSQLPIVPIFLDIILPLNESRPKMLVVKGEYYIDPFDYYYQFYFWYMFVAVVTISVLVSIDTTFSAVVHQNLGIFCIVKHRIHLASKYQNYKDDTSYKIIVKAIQLHKGALQFIDLIESSYRTSFLIIVGLTVLFLSLVAIIVMEYSSDMLEIMRWTMMELGVLVHLLYLSYPGQEILDHSSDIFVQVYMSEWYAIPRRGKNLLRIIMLRGLKPSVLTAGGLYILAYENYGAIIKTAMSYITFLASFRG